jgi:cupin 2 domain-containing protein
MTGPVRGNLADAIPGSLPEELVSVLAAGRDVRIERIVSRGHASEPEQWYDQDEHEFILVTSGRARLVLAEGDVMELGPGDWVNIPAHARHRVEWTDPDADTVWMAVYYR